MTKRRLGLTIGVAALATLTTAVLLAQAVEGMRVKRPALQPLAPDLRLSLTAPAPGARTEVDVVRVEGRVEGTSPYSSAARVEIGFVQSGQYVASTTISVPVGGTFSELVRMPGAGPHVVYAGIVHLTSVARVADVGVRPPMRDLSTGSRQVAWVHLVDERGRRMDGRILVSQAGTAVGETHTSGGIAMVFDLAPGGYTLSATAIGGGTGSVSFRIPGGSPVVCNITIRP